MAWQSKYMSDLSNVKIREIIEKNHLVDNKGVRTVVEKMTGEKLSRDGSKKELGKFLKKWADTKNNETKNTILNNAGLSKYGSFKSSREKIDKAFNSKKIKSSSELRAEEKIRKIMIRRNIAASRASASFGQQKSERGSMFMKDIKARAQVVHQGVHSASIGGASTRKNLSFQNENNKGLSVDKDAYKPAGGFGSKNSAAPGIGRGGIVGSMGMGRL